MTNDGNLYVWGYYTKRKLTYNQEIKRQRQHDKLEHTNEEDHKHSYFELETYNDTFNEYYNFDAFGLYKITDDQFCSKKSPVDFTREDQNQGKDSKAYENSNQINKKADIIDKIVAVSCGDRFSLALSKSGELYVWGSNDYSQHGTSDTFIDNFYADQIESKKVQIPNDMQSCKYEIFPHPLEEFNMGTQLLVSNVSAGKKHIVAIVNDKYVYTWGSNKYGQCGKDKM